MSTRININMFARVGRSREAGIDMVDLSRSYLGLCSGRSSACGALVSGNRYLKKGV